MDQKALGGSVGAASSATRRLTLPERASARTSRKCIRILLADGQALFREAMRTCLNRASDLRVVGEVARASEIAQAVSQTQPDVVLTDFVLPDAADGRVLLELKTKCPDVRVVVLTSVQEEQCITRALADGAYGFVMKEAQCALVVKAIRAAHAGQTWVQREIIGQLIAQLYRSGAQAPAMAKAASLTQREHDVLRLLAMGKTTAEIAQELYLSQSTVRVHLGRILDKLELKNRIEAVRYAIKHGLVEL